MAAHKNLHKAKVKLSSKHQILSEVINIILIFIYKIYMKFILLQPHDAVLYCYWGGPVWDPGASLLTFHHPADEPLPPGVGSPVPHATARCRHVFSLMLSCVYFQLTNAQTAAPALTALLSYVCVPVFVLLHRSLTPAQSSRFKPSATWSKVCSCKCCEQIIKNKLFLFCDDSSSPQHARAGLNVTTG